jgi:hypothetical protein
MGDDVDNGAVVGIAVVEDALHGDRSDGVTAGRAVNNVTPDVESADDAVEAYWDFQGDPAWDDDAWDGGAVSGGNHSLEDVDVNAPGEDLASVPAEDKGEGANNAPHKESADNPGAAYWEGREDRDSGEDVGTDAPGGNLAHTPSENEGGGGSK